MNIFKWMPMPRMDADGGGAAPPAPPAPAPTAPPAPAPAKTFTQEDVNASVARESKSAVEKLLKEAGIAPECDCKTAMKTSRSVRTHK